MLRTFTVDADPTPLYRDLHATAEAEVPRAIAEAFRSGNLGIMDYYRMRNIQADTDMRESLSGDETDRSI